MSRRLEVLLHGEGIGELAELATGGGSEFRFLPAYRDRLPRPVLGQSFEDDLKKPRRSRPRTALPDFFANLAPEGRLRELIEQKAGLEAGDDLALLFHVGEDLPGAVTVRPFEGEVLISEQWETGVEVGDSPSADEGLRFSLAGIQLKLSMLLRGERFTLPMHGEAGEWIVKFESSAFPYLPQNEYSMLEWARAAGFDVPECRLLDLAQLAEEIEPLGIRPPTDSASQLLAVRRYDRTVEGRVHQEDFAQAIGLPPAKKYDQIRYEDLARLVRQFIDEAAVDEYVRRLVFTVASGNGDAHLKNWSLTYPDRIRAAWSPLYDQVSTVAWAEPSRTLALKLAGVKDFHRIDSAAFDLFADRAGIESKHLTRLLDETLARLQDAWLKIGDSLPLIGPHRDALMEHWRRVPLLRTKGWPD